MVRKATAVVISIFLSSGSVVVQARAMLGMVLASLAIHYRIQPYDDQNPSVRKKSGCSFVRSFVGLPVYLLG